MGRMKELFSELLEDAVSAPWVQEELILGNLEKEDFVTEKNGIETVITVYFNKHGYPVKHQYHSQRKTSEKEKRIFTLENEIAKAVNARNFLKAAELQKELDILKNQK